MPTAVLRVLSEQMPRLQAEENIERSNVLMFAAGKLAQSDRDRLAREWERVAAGPLGSAGRARPSSDSALLQVQALGIDVVKEAKS